MNKTPYFSLQALLRDFSKALGTKSREAKHIDNACLQLDVSPFRFNEFKNNLIKEDISKIVNIPFANHIFDQYENMEKSYINFMNDIPLDGVDIDKAQEILDKKLLSSLIAHLCMTVFDAMKITAQDLALSGKTAMQFMMERLKSDRNWCQYTDSLDCDQKARFNERLYKWTQDSPELLDLSTIASFGGQYAEYHDWKVIKARLITARIWDYYFVKSGLCDINFIKTTKIQDQSDNIIHSLNDLRREATHKHKNYGNVSQELFGLLLLRHPRSEEKKQIIVTLLEKVNNYLLEYDKDNEVSYFYYWMNGRYLLHCGELDEALKMYKIAFEHVLYRNNEATQKIVKEAILIASRIPTPDKAFINRLRNISGLFHFEILPAEFTNPKKKKTEVIEPWEIDAYAQFFNSYFTKESFFPGAVYPDFSAVPYGVVLDDQQHKLDIKKPDKVISVGMGGGLVKRMPQLVYYAWNADEDSVDALIEAGAHVDKIAKTSKESALLMAVQAMQVNRFPIKNLSDRMFNTIAAKRHTSETVNLITAKRRLTALGCAIQTGRLDIVKKVVELGADIDQRHDVGLETPLFTCIGLLIHHKRPITAAIHAEKIKFSDLNLRSLMANNVGLVPHDKEGLIQYLREKESDATYSSIMDKIKAIEIDSILQNTSIEGFREIAKYLIDQGADVNAKHNTALKGFTPLMLAAELDETGLCEYMLNTRYKGNIHDTCFDPQTNRRYTVREIAAAWQSKEALKVLVL
ncbi:ankyrin repeat domain-containing protein [Photobacterium damselae subsp. damselae]|uniref:ankyrin repeat domain-containing protein n=1 Tax=Photobacterium damselae TaxID=38293 RepID=UPI001F2E482C|nr:ankyrin repeat domain-containing protein [Photobacterium damselae]UKA27475.1 ankyrin repeat domain-containing protein [Photobacterium damselae subsp. damselae]